MPGGLKSGSARSMQDIVGGVILVLIALVALYLVRDLPATGRVGFASGTAPRLFAYGLLALGAYITVMGFITEGPEIEGFPLRGPLAILGSVLFFAISIRTLGLAVTGVPMVMMAAMATPEGRWKESLIFAICMTAFCGLLFPTILGQPIPLWPRF